MSSHIMAYGYIEVPKGTEGENACILEGLVKQYDPENAGLASSVAKACSGWPSSTFSFARSFKKSDNQQSECLVSSFETLVYAMRASAARIHLEDDEGLVDISIIYTYGPRQFGAEDEWIREEAS